MGIVAWVVLGLVAGYVASLLVNSRGAGVVMDVILGIVGAVVGGLIAQIAGIAGISGLNFYSLLIAISGAVVVLLLYHTLSRPRSTA